MTQPTSVPAEVTLPELTFRGVLLGAVITIIFTASNVFLGLKVGLTFSSAIPAAVISMSVLRLFKDANGQMAHGKRPIADYIVPLGEEKDAYNRLRVKKAANA